MGTSEDERVTEWYENLYWTSVWDAAEAYWDGLDEAFNDQYGHLL